MATRLDAGWVAPTWEALLAAGVRVFPYVPDAGLAGLIARAHEDERCLAVPLTTEEEGVALAVGTWLAGRSAAVLLQSSGVGNCVNMLSLPAACAAPLLMVVTMRGQFGERNPWQVPMGQAVAPVLAACGVVTLPVDEPAAVPETVAAAAAMATTGGSRVAVLIGQRVIGAKAFAAPEPS
jgi:sulfopyruvate decarboxylase TPP-binding subunit